MEPAGAHSHFPFRPNQMPKELKQRMQDYFQTMWSLNHGIDVYEVSKRKKLMVVTYVSVLVMRETPSPSYKLLPSKTSSLLHWVRPLSLCSSFMLPNVPPAERANGCRNGQLLMERITLGFSFVTAWTQWNKKKHWLLAVRIVTFLLPRVMQFASTLPFLCSVPLQ